MFNNINLLASTLFKVKKKKKKIQLTRLENIEMDTKINQIENLHTVIQKR